MSLFVLIAYAVVILTGATLVLSIGVVLFHSFAMKNERHLKLTRANLKRSLVKYLDGYLDAEHLKLAILGKEDLLFGVVAQLSTEVAADRRLHLAEIFELPGLKYLLELQLREISDESWEDRIQAAWHLAFMGNRDVVVRHLMAALEDEMLDVRLVAAHSLSNLKASEAVPAILDHLVQPTAWPTKRATEIIIEMGEVSILPLLQYLKLPDVQAAGTAAAIAALGVHRARDAVQPLINYLTHLDAEIRLQSAKALGAIGNKQAGPMLLEAMQDPVWEVRAATAKALAVLKYDAAVPVLTESLSDPEWWVRFDSANALSGLGKSGIDALKNSLSEDDRFAREISRMVLEDCGYIAAEGSVPA